MTETITAPPPLTPPAAGMGTTSTPPPPPVHWSTSMTELPEVVRGHASLQTFKSPADAIKAYVDVQPLIGADKVPLPKDWTDAKQVQAFNEKIGVPASPDKYSIDLSKVLPQGKEANKDTVAWLQKTAHEQGMRPTQAQALAEGFTKLQFEAAQQAELAAESGRVAALQKFQSEQGGKYQATLAKANLAFRRFASQELQNKAASLHLTRDPDFIQAWAPIGEWMMEDGAQGGLPPTVDQTSPEGATLLIEKLKKDELFMKALNEASNPGHKAALKQWVDAHKFQIKKS